MSGIPPPDRTARPSSRGVPSGQLNEKALPVAVSAAPLADRMRRFERLARPVAPCMDSAIRSEEHTSELQSLMRSSYAVFCLKKKNMNNRIHFSKCKKNKNT